MAGNVALFGRLRVEAAEIGRDVASIDAEGKILREGQASLGRGQRRLEVILIEILSQRNGSEE